MANVVDMCSNCFGLVITKINRFHVYKNLNLPMIGSVFQNASVAGAELAILVDRLMNDDIFNHFNFKLGKPIGRYLPFFSRGTTKLFFNFWVQ